MCCLRVGCCACCVTAEAWHHKCPELQFYSAMVRCHMGTVTRTKDITYILAKPSQVQMLHIVRMNTTHHVSESHVRSFSFEPKSRQPSGNSCRRRFCRPPICLAACRWTSRDPAVTAAFHEYSLAVFPCDVEFKSLAPGINSFEPAFTDINDFLPSREAGVHETGY